MQLHGTPKHKYHASLHPSAPMLRAVGLAIGRAHDALYAGRLLSPGEAAALACGEARSKETLYSIARAVAFDTECDVDEIEAHLNEHFPDLAK